MPEPTPIDDYRNKKKIGDVGTDGVSVWGDKPKTGNRRKALKKGHRVALVDLDVLSRVRMTQAEQAVFMTIARHIPDRGGVEARVSLAEVADEVGMMPQSVSRVIAALVSRDLVIRTNRRGIWYINPHILYNGDFAEWNDTLPGYIEPKADR